MENKYCLKICYHGDVETITCDVGSSYEDIIALAIAHFNISNELAGAIKLTNAAGSRFDKQLLEYFILLFPAPQLIFYLRINWTQVRRDAQTQQAIISTTIRNNINTRQDNAATATTALRESDTQEQQQQHYVAAPVRRQNCFIGRFPEQSSTSTAQTAAELIHEHSFTIARRMRLIAMQQQPRSGNRLLKQRTTSFKRSIRI